MIRLVEGCKEKLQRLQQGSATWCPTLLSYRHLSPWIVFLHHCCEAACFKCLICKNVQSKQTRSSLLCSSAFHWELTLNLHWTPQQCFKVECWTSENERSRAEICTSRYFEQKIVPNRFLHKLSSFIVTNICISRSIINGAFVLYFLLFRVKLFWCIVY